MPRCEAMSDGEFVVRPGTVDMPADRQAAFRLVQCLNMNTQAYAVKDKVRWFCDEHER